MLKEMEYKSSEFVLRNSLPLAYKMWLYAEHNLHNDVLLTTSGPGLRRVILLDSRLGFEPQDIPLKGLSTFQPGALLYGIEHKH